MDAKIVFGRLEIIGKSPDGDSVRIVPNDPDAFVGIYRDWKVKLTGRGNTRSAQLRLEGIDTPETHYGPSFKQPYGGTARDELLTHLGLDPAKLEWSAGGQVKAYDGGVLPEIVIATAGADANGRPISFVWPRESAPAAFQDGQWEQLTREQVARSANFALVRAGHAYATLYTSMPRDQRADFRTAANAARADGLGIWPLDATAAFFFEGIESVEAEGSLVLPKLFRRLVDYSKSVDQGFDGPLEAWLKERASGPRPEDDRVILNDHVSEVATLETSFSEIIETIHQTISLKVDLNDVVFVEK